MPVPCQMEENLHKWGESTLPFYVPLFVCLSVPPTGSLSGSWLSVSLVMNRRYSLAITKFSVMTSINKRAKGLRCLSCSG